MTRFSLSVTTGFDDIKSKPVVTDKLNAFTYLTYSFFSQEAKNDTDLDPALVGDLKIDENDKKKQKRGGRGNVKAKKKAEPAQVKIGRVSRGKKKSVTHITGLASYEVKKIPSQALNKS